MAMHKHLLSVLIVIVPILIVFGIEPLYRQSLYDKTLEDVPNM